jgi:acetylornithine/N-succinyldiaminopimelate aminotransferase
MTATELRQSYQKFVLPTYSPEHLFVRGQGCYLWNAEGRRYLDFTAGISVCNLGHCHPVVTEAIQRQAARLVHVSNLYMNDQAPQLAEALVTRAFDGRAFFANSGAEANEGLIKFARKWGSSSQRHEIICMEHSFHGRTLATLMATDKPAIRQGFAPDMPGFKHVPYNDLAALTQAIGPQTCAILMEPIQGEGGLTPATPEFITGARALCDQFNLLLLFDEVQCGMGRTGRWFAGQHYGVEPDAMSLAKALGNGFPMGAFLVARKHEAVLGAGSHATTFGGTALACAAALAVIQAMDQEEVLFNVQRVGAHLRGGLLALQRKYACIKEVRGVGLMLGVEFDRPVGPMLKRAAELDLLVISAGEKILRLLPPLIVTPEQADDALKILDQAIGEMP